MQRLTLLVLSLELLHEVLTPQVGVPSCRLDLEDTLLDCQAQHTEYESVTLTLDLLVENIGNSSGGWLIDDSEDIETADEAGVLGGLTLRVVEASGNGGDGPLDGLAKEGEGGVRDDGDEVVVEGEREERRENEPYLHVL